MRSLIALFALPLFLAACPAAPVQRAARAMKLDAEVGTVEAGKRADIVVVAGDPLKDIRDVRKISIVVARGRAYEPAKLWQLVGFTP